MRRGFWLYLFFICTGIVLGSMVAELTAGMPVLGWLSYGMDFGTAAPLELDLQVLRLTLGLSVKITVAHILFIALSIVLGRLLTRS